MFLRRLTLKNIRSIPALDLSFEDGGQGRHWTYLLGENGTGKSSVLRSIALVMSGGQAAGELVGDVDSWISMRQDEAEIQVSFATAEGQPREASMIFRRGWAPYDFVEHNIKNLRKLDAAIDKADVNYFVMGYGVSRRASAGKFASPEASSPFRSSRAQSVATLFSNSATLVSLDQWAMDLEYRRGRTGLAMVKSAFDTLLPDVSFLKIDRERRQLLFKTNDGELPLEALSDGYQAMAAWCGDLLFRMTDAFADRKQPMSARGLLLLDELDLHLHPIWQRRLVSFLTKLLPNFQFVVTTHSPLTIHQASQGELFVLRRDGPGGEVALRPFMGAPKTLLLTQLLQSPLFGLDTLESPEVEGMRQELRRLQGVGAARAPTRSTRNRARIDELAAHLATMPDLQQTPPYLQETNRVLSRLAMALSGKESDEEASARPPRPRQR